MVLVIVVAVVAGYLSVCLSLSICKIENEAILRGFLSF